MGKTYIQELISATIEKTKIPFEILDSEELCYEEDIIKGNIYIGISKKKLRQTFNIDDEVPTLYKGMIRSKDINEFLKVNIPIDEKSWSILFGESASDIAADNLNPEGRMVKLTTFSTNSIEIKPYQILLVMYVELERDNL